MFVAAATLAQGASGRASLVVPGSWTRARSCRVVVELVLGSSIVGGIAGGTWLCRGPVLKLNYPSAQQLLAGTSTPPPASAVDTSTEFLHS